MDRSNILFPVIEYYLGCQIDSLDDSAEPVTFSLDGGSGILAQNYEGNWEVIIGEEKVAEIEGVVLNSIFESKNHPDVQSYYNKLKNLLKEEISFRSGCLVKDIIASLEYLLVNENIQIKDPINVGNFFLFSMENQKEIICLN